MASDGEKSGKPWHWKPGDASAPQPGLLYEPGNWGDVLKGTWACQVADAVAKSNAKGIAILYDPFAGAPDYPLTQETQKRFDSLPESLFKAAQRSFVERERWASTASVVQASLALWNYGNQLAVFDADDERRAAWRGRPGVSIFPFTSGLEVLQRVGGELTPDFSAKQLVVLVDPYDLFDRWGVFLDAAQNLAQRCPVLLYLYNKSPRGTGYADQYGRFRIALANRFRDCGVKVRLGRLPSDLKEPRAYHEVVLAAPSNYPRTAFEDELRAATEALAKLFPEPFSCFEDGLRPEGA
ncbi:MAG: hypothetical protein L6R28_01775 [Planctomycetes bacterium]|nr:hypothetical protein [Planctomycetota bacterium]